MTYAQQAFDFLQEKGYITHKNIQKITGCNCCYSVLRNLRKILDFQGIELHTEQKRNPRTKRPYTRYFIEVA